MQANALCEAVERLVVERGLVAVQADGGHCDGEQPAGYAWSSDPRLTLPTMVRMTEPQVHDLVRGIACPTRVIHADPPQPYLPEPLRSERVGLLPRGALMVLRGGHHLHMEQPADVAAAIGGFLRDAEGAQA
jgi:pimeloyl-ACP methyl ester carboxylesterase